MGGGYMTLKTACARVSNGWRSHAQDVAQRTLQRARFWRDTTDALSARLVSFGRSQASTPHAPTPQLSVVIKGPGTHEGKQQQYTRALPYPTTRARQLRQGTRERRASHQTR
jgi:hypothetical protein